MLPIAHAGHWALGLVEAFPLIAVAAFAAWSNLRGTHLGMKEDELPDVTPENPSDPQWTAH
jgi:hypothetical protein